VVWVATEIVTAPIVDRLATFIAASSSTKRTRAELRFAADFAFTTIETLGKSLAARQLPKLELTNGRGLLRSCSATRSTSTWTELKLPGEVLVGRSADNAPTRSENGGEHHDCHHEQEPVGVLVKEQYGPSDAEERLDELHLAYSGDTTHC
jgi:hypothetical protein